MFITITISVAVITDLAIIAVDIIVISIQYAVPLRCMPATESSKDQHVYISIIEADVSQLQ